MYAQMRVVNGSGKKSPEACDITLAWTNVNNEVEVKVVNSIVFPNKNIQMFSSRRTYLTLLKSDLPVILGHKWSSFQKEVNLFQVK